jgi:hypothetical protein
MSSPGETTPVTGASGPGEWWRGLPARTRRRLWRVLFVTVVAVLLVSVVLARFLTVENTERDAALALVQAEARGDAASVLSKLSGCSASRACVASVRANVANPRLLRAGPVKILSLESATAYSLTSATGETRLAWTVLGTLPVVQCVRVRRTGNFLTGIHVQLLGLSAPIENEGICRKRTQRELEELELNKALGQ